MGYIKKIQLLCFGFFFLIILKLGTPIHLQAEPSFKDMHLGAWVTYWDFNRGVNQILNAEGTFHDAFIFSAILNYQGQPTFIKPEINYSTAVARFKAKGITTWLTVVNDVMILPDKQIILKDSEVVSRILSTKKTRQKLSDDLIGILKMYGFSGLDIDFENLQPEDRDGFSEFIKEISDKLKKENLLLSITVQPKYRDKRSVGPGAMDWAQLCTYADRLQIMLYNQHSSKTGPGPMATPQWISKVLDYGLSQCQSERLVPILKVSGMRWGPKGVKGIQYDSINSFIKTEDIKVERDLESEVPYFAFYKDNEKSTLYYEDARSLKKKLMEISSKGFGKTVFWSLGRQDPNLIKILK